MKAAKEKTTKKTKGTANSLRSTQFDPLGSYTGVGANPYEVPEQDADDL